MEHHLDGIEIGNYAVFEGADGDDAFRRFADHRLAFDADREGALGFGIDRDDGRLRDNDALAPNVNERIGGAEVDPEVTAKKSK